MLNLRYLELIQFYKFLRTTRNCKIRTLLSIFCYMSLQNVWYSFILINIFVSTVVNHGSTAQNWENKRCQNTLFAFTKLNQRFIVQLLAKPKLNVYKSCFCGRPIEMKNCLIHAVEGNTWIISSALHRQHYNLKAH